MKREIYTMLRIAAGLDYRGILSDIEKVNTPEGLYLFQQDSLKSLILHAYRYVAYYHRIFDEVGVVVNGEVNLSRFESIPILTKEIIRKYPQELISRDYRKRRWSHNSSGGSTGEPIHLMQDYTYRKWGDASFQYWYKSILGIDEARARKVVLWGSMRDLLTGKEDWKVRLANWASNTIFLNSFRMTEEEMKRYIRVINDYKPELVRGYATSLYELCRYARKSGMQLYTPRAVVSTADMLLPEMRTSIEDQFGTKVYNFYGSRETNNLAGECKNGLMHVLGFHNYVEVVNAQDKAVKEGEEGRIVVTNLHNYVMPLIRYEIGDMAKIGPMLCGCGSILPTLNGLEGRISDYFIKEDGTLVSPHAIINRLRQISRVQKFQIIQEDYESIRVVIVPNGEPQERDKMTFEKSIQNILSKDCKVTWDFVTDITQTPQGKHRYTRTSLR
jgi:phenylacetate-CoA ligase